MVSNSWYALYNNNRIIYTKLSMLSGLVWRPSLRLLLLVCTEYVFELWIGCFICRALAHAHSHNSPKQSREKCCLIYIVQCTKSIICLYHRNYTIQFGKKYDLMSSDSAILVFMFHTAYSRLIFKKFLFDTTRVLVELFPLLPQWKHLEL